MSSGLSPQQPSPSSKTDNRSRNLALAIVVSLVIVCAGLAVVAQLLQEEELGESDYSVKDFDAAAQALGIEAVAEWPKVEGESFTIALPQRLDPLSETEIEQMVGMVGVDLQGADLQTMALDTDIAQSGVNVMVSIMPDSDNLTPDEYVSGVGDEMKKAGYSIKDKSAYELDGERVGRLIYETTMASGQRMTGVQFATSQGGTIWVMTGTGLSSEFDDWLPVFEAIMRELEIE